LRAQRKVTTRSLLRIHALAPFRHPAYQKGTLLVGFCYAKLSSLRHDFGGRREGPSMALHSSIGHPAQLTPKIAPPLGQKKGYCLRPKHLDKNLKNRPNLSFCVRTPIEAQRNPNFKNLYFVAPKWLYFSVAQIFVVQQTSNQK
jgi:hypothetical protein